MNGLFRTDGPLIPLLIVLGISYILGGSVFAQTLLYPGNGRVTVFGIPGSRTVNHPTESPITSTALPQAAEAPATRLTTGYILCADNEGILLVDDAYRDGGYKLQFRGRTYFMHKVASLTGAPRLENGEGIVWLELANKSMLLDEAQSIRLVDECQTSAQALFTARAKVVNPDPLGLLR